MILDLGPVACRDWKNCEATISKRAFSGGWKGGNGTVLETKERATHVYLAAKQFVKVCFLVTWKVKCVWWTCQSGQEDFHAECQLTVF